jgi:hypothetical protein
MNFALHLPINNVSFGQVSIGILRYLKEKDYSPIPGLDYVRDFLWTWEVAESLVRLVRSEVAPPVVQICSGKGTRIRDIAEESRNPVDPDRKGFDGVAADSEGFDRDGAPIAEARWSTGIYGLLGIERGGPHSLGRPDQTSQGVGFRP